MSSSLKQCVLLVALLALVSLTGLAWADIYMQNPGGSNNRNCERAEQTRNQNRLYNSQNNNNGGYNCPRPQGGRFEVEDVMGDRRMYFYEGSVLPIQWTNQHSCGRNNTQCTVVIQYACEDTAPGMRDGTPTKYDGSVESTATETIPDDRVRHRNELYGQHETYDYYQKCKARRRNAGLWIADRNIREDRPATHTRQNNNGARYGFECPEERDYYPYWHPSPWKDIAVLTWNTTMCDYYQYFSENTLGRGECVEDDEPYSRHNNPNSCAQEGGKWVERDPHGIDPPECIDNSIYNVRDNHLGSVGFDGEMATYNWTIPHLPEGVSSFDRCVIRIRYNITTDEVSFNDTDHRHNMDNSPLRQDPLIDVGSVVPVELAINTDQNPRTFQDRSYTFKIVKRPTKVKLGEEEVHLDPWAKIYNVNVRGKRGNIVQTYPSLEYDFVPQWLSLRGGDWIHLQWIGSDYNPNRNPNNAEGGPPIRGTRDNSGSDRSNFAQAHSLGILSPRPAANFTFFKVPPHGEVDVELAKRLIFLDQDLTETRDEYKCMTTAEIREKYNLGENAAQFHVQNCGKLSGQKHPYFDGGLFQVNSNGRFTFMSTRNNNFSNRRQVMQIEVTGGRWNSAGSVRASIVLVAVLAVTVLLAIF